MKRSITLTLLTLLLLPLVTRAQSSTTEALRKKHSDALDLFFYNNTLRMLNQERELAQRIEQSIKQLRSRTGGTEERSA